MQKTIYKFIVVLIILFLTFYILYKINNVDNKILDEKPIEEENVKDYSVSKNGWLSVENTKILNQDKETIQLYGISSHGIEWYYDLITYDNLKHLKENWNMNIFRVAMYSQNYISNPDVNKEKLTNIIDIAIDLDIYVIVDWHILSDNNPNIYKEQANAFFNEISLKYKDVPNIIYEICNEPNGNSVTWKKHIKPYAEYIIPTIRNNSPKSLIIVGTPDWCKKLNKAADDPLNFENIAYACHFYSGTHNEELQKEIDYALNKNICIFVSECSMSDASGDGDLYFDNFDSWIKFLDERKISFVVWSLSNKNESSAILNTDYHIIDTSPNDNQENITQNILDENTLPLNFDEYLSEAGKYLKKIFSNRK